MKKNFWKNNNVLVTGGAGFIGSHVVEKLVARGARVTVLDNLENGKLKNLSSVKDVVTITNGDCANMADALRACTGKDVVMNLAARVGGIEYNRTHQATMLRDNLAIGLTMTEAAHRAGVKRFLAVSSACVYPRACRVPTPESEGFIDEPEPTNGGYGWAKRMAELLAKYYTEEFKMQIAVVRPYNCYGPRDHFDPKTSHVIPALIKRVFDGENPIVVWGTGRQTRAFLFVEDLAEGMIAAVDRYPAPDPVNLGTDEEVTIKELVMKIITLSGRKVAVQFDRTKPDGSLRRNSDNTKARKHLRFDAKIRLDEGLTKTIAWYRHEYHR